MMDLNGSNSGEIFHSLAGYSLGLRNGLVVLGITHWRFELFLFSTLSGEGALEAVFFDQGGQALIWTYLLVINHGKHGT